MKYKIGNYYLNDRYKIEDSFYEIPVYEFNILKKSRNILYEALNIESLYEIIINNYIEFQKELYGLLLEFTIKSKNDLNEITFNINLFLNRRIINLLSSIKLYIDSMPHNIRVFNFIPKDIEKLFNNEYDLNFYYRLMEAVRNYTQHNGLPIDLLTISSENSDNNSHWSIDIYGTKKKFNKDKKFKKLILTEFEDKVSLKTAIQSYIESINSVHINIRTMISNIVNDSIKNIEDVLNKNKNTEMYMINTDDNDNEIEKIYLSLKDNNIRLKLLSKNIILHNIRIDKKV